MSLGSKQICTAWPYKQASCLNYKLLVAKEIQSKEQGFNKSHRSKKKSNGIREGNCGSKVLEEKESENTNTKWKLSKFFTRKNQMATFYRFTLNDMNGRARRMEQ